MKKPLVLIFLSFCLFGHGAGHLQAEPVYIDPSEKDISFHRAAKMPEIDYQRSGMRVLYRSTEPRGETWLYDAAMSRGCRRGTFKQRANLRYIAYFADEIYGAALGGHKSLVDDERLSEADVLYVFKGQGTTGCRVYHRTR